MYTKTGQLKKKSKPKKKRKKLATRKAVIKNLDDVIRKIVRKRDKWCCSCAKRLENNLQVSHYVGRRHYALRWDLRNVHGSCPGCNLKHNYDPNPYSLFMVGNYGAEIFVEFKDIKNKHVKFTTPDLRELLEQLKNENY